VIDRQLKQKESDAWVTLVFLQMKEFMHVLLDSLELVGKVTGSYFKFCLHMKIFNCETI